MYFSDAISKLNVVTPRSGTQAEDILTGPMLTGGYRPSIPAESYWSTEGVYLPLMLWDVEHMLVHDSVSEPYGHYKAGIASVTFDVDASSSKVGEFVLSELRSFWENHLDEAQKVYDYGWLGCEAGYEYEGDRLRMNRLEAFHALDVWALTGEHGAFKGISVQSGAGEAYGGDWAEGPASMMGKRTLWGGTKYPPKGVWFSHKRRYNRWYGRSQLYEAWRPWRRLATRDHAEDILDGGVYRFAYSGPQIRFPVEDYKDPSADTDNEAYRNARNVARQIADSYKTGANVGLPSNRDEHGEYIWSLDFPNHQLNIEGMLAYVRYLERKIARGIEVPPELYESVDIGSGWSGRKIPLLSFYTKQLKNARAFLRAFNDQVLKRLVLWNFGPHHKYTVKVKVVMPEGLAEGASPVIGQPPAPALPGAGMPGAGANPAGDQNQSLQNNPLAALLQPPQGKQLSRISELGDFIWIGKHRRGNVSAKPCYLLALSDDSGELPLYTDENALADLLTSQALRALEADVKRVWQEASQALESWVPGTSYDAVTRAFDSLVKPATEILAAAQTAAMLQGAREIADRVEVVGQAPPGPSLEETGKLFSFMRSDRMPMIRHAVKSLRNKGVITSESFRKMVEEARNTSGGAMEMESQEVADVLHDALADAVERGMSTGEFRRDVKNRLGGQTVLARHRLEQVFRTAVMSAYAEGQEKALENPAVSEMFPYVLYRAIHDKRTRPDHRALEKLGIQGTACYRRDDPVIKLFCPPWAWACRCSLTPLTVRQAASLGIKEAQEWLRTGAAPLQPAWVDMPPFSPPEGFDRQAIMLSAADDLGDGWIRHGASRTGRKRWVSQKGEIRYQDDSPGSRGKLNQSPAPPVPSRLSGHKFEELRRVMDAAHRRMSDPDHPIRKNIDNLHNATFKGQTIRTLMPGGEQKLSADDHHRLATEHHAAARALVISGRKDLAMSHKAARDYHRGLSGGLEIPDDDDAAGIGQDAGHEAIGGVLDRLSDQARDWLAMAVKEIVMKKGRDGFVIKDDDGPVSIHLSYDNPGGLGQVLAAAVAHLLDGKEGIHSSSPGWLEAGGNVSAPGKHWIEFGRKALCPGCKDFGEDRKLLRYWLEQGLLREGLGDE